MQHSKSVRKTSPKESHVEFFLTAEDTNGMFEWFTLVVPYGDGPIYHSHQRADEMLQVVTGELKVKLDGVLTNLMEGDICYIPRGIPHAYTNVHTHQTVRLMGLFSPAGFQTFIKVWETVAKNGAPDEILLAEMAARYDQYPHGPPLAVELHLPVTP